MDENTKAITIRIPAEFYEQIRDEAARSGRSLNAQIVQIIAAHCQEPDDLRQRLVDLEATVAALQEKIGG